MSLFWTNSSRANASKMSALGNMAAGIAHGINNRSLIHFRLSSSIGPSHEKARSRKSSGAKCKILSSLQRVAKIIRGENLCVPAIARSR